MRIKKSQTPKAGQLELDFDRPREPDRNHEFGGRSFYFFDLDDNVMFLSTPIYVFHKSTGKEIALSTKEFGQNSRHIGVCGAYRDYFVSNDDHGSFRRFRDWTSERLQQFFKTEQPFLEDIAEALVRPDFQWKGPSWKFFFHAVHNQRPMSIITARGHHPDTLKDGLKKLVHAGFLSAEPNYMSVYPVSHTPTRQELGDHTQSLSVAELKRRAIISSVEAAMKQFGENPYHRFGMSDDDPHNIDYIMQAMRELKKKYPENSFFVITSHQDPVVKQEIFVDHVETHAVESDQLNLIDNES